MKLSIVDSCSPLNKQVWGCAARWLSWECEKNGLEIVPVFEDADVLLVTTQYPENASFIRTLKKKFPKTIIAGGGGAQSPYEIGTAADIVCVGDGQRMIQTLAQIRNRIAEKMKRQLEEWKKP